MKKIARKVKPPTVARITTTRLPDDDLAVVVPEGKGTGLGDGGVIWIDGGVIWIDGGVIWIGGEGAGCGLTLPGASAR